MKDVMHFAGSLAAHAVWCVSSGGTLVPILGETRPNGDRAMNRLVYDRLERAVEAGREKLDAPEVGVRNAVLLYDGFITVEDWRTDAIMIDIRCHKGGSAGRRVVMAVPYKAKKGWFSKFVVYRPKFVESSDGALDYEKCGEAFFAGVESHPKGAKIWTRHLDQSR
jgi:hypothetical protein